MTPWHGRVFESVCEWNVNRDTKINSKVPWISSSGSADQLPDQNLMFVSILPTSFSNNFSTKPFYGQMAHPQHRRQTDKRRFHKNNNFVVLYCFAWAHLIIESFIEFSQHLKLFLNFFYWSSTRRLWVGLEISCHVAVPFRESNQTKRLSRYAKL